jgi:hypothetical protein
MIDAGTTVQSSAIAIVRKLELEPLMSKLSSNQIRRVGEPNIYGENQNNK